MKLQLAVFSVFFFLLFIIYNLSECLHLKNAMTSNNSRFKYSEILIWLHKAREETKFKILKGLGISAPPALLHRQKLIYRQRLMRIRRELKAKTDFKIYRAWVGPTNGGHRLLFAVEECKEGYECHVLEASLQIYFHLKRQGAKPRTKLIIVNVRDGGSNSVLTTETKLLSNSSWLKFNIKSAVEKWVANPINNQGIKVSCFGCRADIDAALWFWKWENGSNSFPNPELTLGLRSKKKRTHAQTTNRFCTRNATHCCRRRFYLDFHKLGWHWVVHPRRLKVNICHGNCDITYSTKSYTILLQTVSKAQSCCYPSKYSPYLITYFSNDGTLQRKTFQDISVDGCSCP